MDPGEALVADSVNCLQCFKFEQIRKFSLCGEMSQLSTHFDYQLFNIAASQSKKTPNPSQPHAFEGLQLTNWDVNWH